MPFLHAVNPASTLGRDESGIHHDFSDAISKGCDNARHHQTPRGMGDQGDLSGEPGRLDIGYNRGNLLLHRQGGKVCSFSSPAG
jgi:hypothetical protein